MMKTNRLRVNIYGLYALFSFIALMICSSISYADARSDADLMYQYCATQDYEHGFPLTLKLAKEGNIEAQHNLAYMYENGQGVKSDIQAALHWYQKAASAGFSLSQTNLGYMYQYGQGVKQNYKEAFKWYSKAAAQGGVTAKNNLAVLYSGGLGVTKNEEKAFQLYDELAKTGDAKAQNTVGARYLSGQGVQQNIPNAIYWFKKAAKQAYALSEYNLGLIYSSGIGIAIDDGKARFWLNKSASHGYKQATELLEEMKSNNRTYAYVEWILMALVYVLIIFYIAIIYRLAKVLPKSTFKSWFVWLSLVPFIGPIVYILFMLKLSKKLKLNGNSRRVKHFRFWSSLQLLSITALALCVWSTFIMKYIFHFDFMAKSARILAAEGIFIFACSVIIFVSSIFIAIKAVQLRKQV